jgi:hypothetical protein
MIRLCSTLPRPSGIPRDNRSARASHSTFHLRQSTSFFSHCCALFCTANNPNSFRFIFFHTLCTKHPGWVSVAQASACALSSPRPKSTCGSAPPDLSGIRHHPFVNPACPEERSEGRREPRSESRRAPIPLRTCTYAKHIRNSFRKNTSKTQHLKSFRIRTYEKDRRGAPRSTQSFCSLQLFLRMEQIPRSHVFTGARGKHS